MQYSSTSSGKFYLAIILATLAFIIFQKNSIQIDIALALGIFFSLLIPIIIVVVRRELRISRTQAADVLRKDLNPSSGIDFHFEFMKMKYSSPFPASLSSDSGPEPSGRLSLDYYEWLLLVASVPFVILTAAGIFIMFLPASQLPELAGGSVGANILSVGGLSDAGPQDYENAVTIASLAFAGAFLYCLRLFLKALLAFDLSAITFLRAFAHMLFATILAVVIWRAAPGFPLPTSGFAQSAVAIDRNAPAKAAAASGVPAPAKPEPAPKLMLFLAFAVGFLPDTAFSWIGRQARLLVSRRPARLARHSAATPLTVIDGIDFTTAYRLEEMKIANVENLAASNPVMLNVETAIGLFALVDWIGQAQLCAAVGPHRFLLLRKLNLRTIFDLERAVLDPSAPMGLKQMVGAVLLASDGKTTILRDFGLRPLEVTYREFDKALTSWVNIEVIEHLARVIVDDLHVHRLRQISQAIEARLDPAEPGGRPRAPLKIAASQTPAKSSAHGNGSMRDRASGDVPAGVQSLGEP